MNPFTATVRPVAAGQGSRDALRRAIHEDELSAIVRHGDDTTGAGQRPSCQTCSSSEQFIQGATRHGEAAAIAGGIQTSDTNLWQRTESAEARRPH